jgi:uncharacterized protein YukE
MVSIGDVMRLAALGTNNVFLVIDLGARIIGNEPPSEILMDIRRTDPESALPHVNGWSDASSTVGDRVQQIQSDLTTLQSNWTGEAADAAAAYLAKLQEDLQGVSDLEKSLGTILESSITVVRNLKRAEEDAFRTYALTLIGGCIPFAIAIASALAAGPVTLGASTAAIPPLLVAALGFIGGVIIATISYIMTLYAQHQRATDDLKVQLERLESAALEAELPVPGSVATAAPTPVTIKTNIQEPPPVPAFG